MRPILALIAINLLLTGTGAGVLVGLGVVRMRVGDLLAAGGLALVTGVAASSMAQILLLVAGLEVRFVTAVVVTLLIAAAGLAAGVARGRRGHAGRPVPPPDGDGALLDAPAGTGPPAAAAAAPPRGRLARLTGGSAEAIAVRLVALAGAVVVGIFLVRSVQVYHDTPVLNFDEFAIWSKKAFALYYLGGLDPAFFANPSLNPIHLEYPILLPVLEAFFFRGMGRLDVGLVHVELLVLLIAIVWAAAWLVARERRNWLWLAILLLLFVSPFAQVQQNSGLADITMASFAMLGALAVGQWFERGARAMLALGAIMFAASANTKVDGLLTTALAFALILVLVLVRRSRRDVLPLVLAGVVVAVLVLPWRVWVAAHPEINSFFNFHQALDPGFMLGRRNLVWPGWQQLDDVLAEPTNMLFLVPIAVAMAILAIATGVDRLLAIFYLGLSVLFVLAILWIFVANPATWSAGRVISAPAMVAIAGLLHLGARISLPGALARGSAEPEPVPDAAR